MNDNPRECPHCHQCAARYDSFEDCYLCMECGAILYPEEFGDADNPDAGIWQLAQ